MLSRTEKIMDMVNTVNEEKEDDDLCESCGEYILSVFCFSSLHGSKKMY